jgi:hypothetical protein
MILTRMEVSIPILLISVTAISTIFGTQLINYVFLVVMEWKIPLTKLQVIIPNNVSVLMVGYGIALVETVQNGIVLELIIRTGQVQSILRCVCALLGLTGMVLEFNVWETVQMIQILKKLIILQTLVNVNVLRILFGMLLCLCVLKIVTVLHTLLNNLIHPMLPNVCAIVCFNGVILFVYETVQMTQILYLIII